MHLFSLNLFIRKVVLSSKFIKMKEGADDTIDTMDAGKCSQDDDDTNIGCKSVKTHNPAVMFFSSLAIPWFFVGRMVGLTKKKEIHPGMFFCTDEEEEV